MSGPLGHASTTQAIQATRPTYSYTERTPAPTVHYVNTSAELDEALEDFEGCV